MPKIVIDTNIGFSGMLNTNSNIGMILIEGRQFYEFFAPDFLKEELFKYKSKIKIIAKYNESKFDDIFLLLFGHVTFIDHRILQDEIYYYAEKLCKHIDEDDTNFVALNEYVQGRIWTGDLKLIKGLAYAGYTRCVKTADLLQEFKLKINK
ncbi:MAG: hypothetical protein KA109_16050 [Saprospiraceae bacterium]|nr:hypothetical protein [Saprospiraceae bacterium]MBP7803140.1 hypothetical protein [Saprospiraceae bacterium]MBP7924342.1 hypothetical protein [Saprospiraceae bacterium]MBP8095721.1 hypothetical protein [Saprospiraceae bacterium]